MDELSPIDLDWSQAKPISLDGSQASQAVDLDWSKAKPVEPQTAADDGPALRGPILRTLDTLSDASGKVMSALEAGAENVAQGVRQGFWQLPVSVNKAIGLGNFPGTQAAEQMAQAAAQEHEQGLEGAPFWERVGKNLAYGAGQMGATLPADIAMGAGVKALPLIGKATEAFPSFALGMGVRKAGDEGPVGLPQGVAEGLAMHGVGELGQGLSVIPRVAVQAASQGALSAGMTTAEALGKTGQLPSGEQVAESAATGAAMGAPFALSPGKMGVKPEADKSIALTPDSPRAPVAADFWSRVNGTGSAVPERRLTSDELEMESTSNPAVAAFAKTFSDLVSDGHGELASKLSITDLGRDGDLSMALKQDGLAPNERNTLFAYAAKNGLSNNVEGQGGRLVYTGDGATFTPVSATDAPTNLLSSPGEQTPPEGAATSSLVDRIIQAESGGDPNAQASTSSAKGVGQFTKQTRDGILKRYGVDAWSKDPAEQRKATEILIEENRKALRNALGREPSDGEVYMAHFLGSGGADLFLRGMAENPNDLALNHATPAAVKANRSIFYDGDQPRTLQQVYDRMSAKVAPKASGETGNNGGTPPQPTDAWPLRPELAALREDMQDRAPQPPSPWDERPPAARIDESLGIDTPMARAAELNSLKQDILSRDVVSRAADEVGAPVPGVEAERLNRTPALPAGTQDFEFVPDAMRKDRLPVRLEDAPTMPEPSFPSEPRAAVDPRKGVVIRAVDEGLEKEGESQGVADRDVLLSKGRRIVQKISSANPVNAFVESPRGGVDFGDIPKEVADSFGGKAAPIRLLNGDLKSGGVHIERRHGEQIRGRGFDDVASFVNHIANDYDAVFKGKGRSIFLAVRGEKPWHYATVKMEYDPEGNFWKVQSAAPSRSEFFISDEGRQKKELLWERAQTNHFRKEAPSAVSGQSNSLAGLTAIKKISSPSEKSNPVTRQSLQDALADTPFRGAIVLDSPADLPDQGLRDYMERTGNLGAKGVYDIQTGKAYVFAKNHGDMADAMVTARDELFHRGTFRWAEEMAAKHPEAGPAFEQFKKFMRNVTVAKRETINTWLEKNGYADLKGTHYGANEWLTHAASRDAPKWYDRYVAAVAQFFRAAGEKIGFDFKLTDAEIRRWSRRIEGSIGQEARLIGGTDQPSALYRKMTEAEKEPTFTEDGLPNETIRELIVRKYFHSMNRLTKTVGVLEKRSGSPLPDEANPALRENLYQGRTEERLRQFEADHVKPLVESIKEAGVSLGDVEDALYAMHAKRRNMVIADRTKGENPAGSGITDAQADEIMAKLRQSGKLEKIYPIVRRVWNINKARLALLQSSGLESPETIQMWRDTYGENYVPLKSAGNDAKGSLIRTILGEGEAQRMRTGRGYDIRGKESRHATGRQTEAGNLLANVLAQYEETAIRAEKNRVGQSFLRMAQDHPDAKLWEIDKTPLKPTFNTKTGEVEVRRDPRYKLADNVLSVKVGGEEHLITIHDNILARAMKNLGAEKSDQLLRIASGVNRFYSLINTSLDPEFLVSNAIRDFQTANLNLTAENKTALAKQISKDALSGAPVKGIYRALREKESAAADEWSQWFDRYRNAGGKVGFFGLRTVENQAKRIENMLAEANGEGWARTKAGGRAVLDYIGDLNGSIENALRLSAFRRSVEAGMSEEKAANLAKELTVNFNKKGEAGSTLNALFLFANASLQGNARILKALVTSKRGAALAGSIVLGSAALAALNRAAGGKDVDGQDFYDKIDDSTKSRNLILMKWWKGDGSYMSLPLPYGYNTLKVVGDQMEALAQGKCSAIDAAGKTASAFVDAFNPLGSTGTLAAAITPTIARPIVEIATNTDFGGNPIKPTQSSFGPKKPESQLAWSTVSKPAKWLAEELNKLTGGNEFEPGKIDVSPEVLEHLWSTYTGGVARFLNRAVNLGMNAYDGTAPATKDIPFVRRIMGEQSPYVTPKQFREASDTILRKETAYLAYKDTDPAQARDYRRDNQEELAMVPKLQAAEKALKPLTVKRNKIKAMDVSNAQKALLLKPIEDQMAAVQKEFIREYLERSATPQDIQKAEKTFTIKQANQARSKILQDYRQAIEDGDTAQAASIMQNDRLEYNSLIRSNHLPVKVIRGDTLRQIRRSMRRGPSRSARRVENYLNTFDDSDFGNEGFVQ